ncbi:MAG TPA: hypothetical protein VLS90_03085 [Thermodesulfobacteriota bacterium]|nr:hypothetical protein [Thermodesulfobacteriota bacterium]
MNVAHTDRSPLAQSLLEVLLDDPDRLLPLRGSRARRLARLRGESRRAEGQTE